MEELVSLLWKQLRFVGKNPEDPEGVINQNAKIASIMTIYFPEFHDHSYNLLELALNYQKIKLDGIDDDIEESMKTYATEHGKFLYDIEQYVKREFQ